MSKENSFLFKFRANIKNKNLKLELPFRIHFEELRQRSLHIFLIFALFSILAFLEIKPIVKILEIPVYDIKFFQLSPGEYFIETIKIALYCALIFTGPILITQISFFINPGLTSKEKELILPMLLISTILVFISIGFSYFYLIPAAVKFFILYSSDVLEPLWSFTQYFDFILVLFVTTALAFQIPIFQVILGILGIISGTQMLKLWKYIILIAVIISAILTPSTDPITQLLLSGAIISLYFLGSGFLILVKR
jgi:sec-independent protein translocase protein TatC